MVSPFADFLLIGLRRDYLIASAHLKNVLGVGIAPHYRWYSVNLHRCDQKPHVVLEAADSRTDRDMLGMCGTTGV